MTAPRAAVDVRLKMAVTTDGGEYNPHYKVENVLSKDSRVYCSARSANVHLTFQLKSHPYASFQLTNFAIQAPCEGYTAPCNTGMLFVSNTQFNIGELEVFDDFSYDDYLEWKTQDSKRASLCPETCFELSPETSYRFDQYFRKPICGKYAVVKLISADNLTCDYRADLRSRSSNIDLKYVSFRGFIGKYAYPTGHGSPVFFLWMLRDSSVQAVDIVKPRSNSFNAPTPANTPLTSAPITSHKVSKPTSSFSMDDKNATSSLLAQNPALLDALQQRFGQLLGKSSGYIESLPEEVKERISVLEGLQQERTRLDAEFRSELLMLEKKYLDLAKPLYLRRAKVIVGDVDAVKGENEPAEKAATKGIPEFWLTCFKNSPIMEDMIQEHDESALTKLRDIQISYLNDNPGFKIDFLFDENDFFTNNVLTKTYYLEDDPTEHKDVMFDHAEGTEIDWKEGKNLSVRVETRKQRHKTSNKTRIVKKTVPCATFFNFFQPPTIPDEDEDDIEEDLEKKIEEDYDVGEFLKEELIPRAIDWFTGKAAMELADQEYEDFGDEEEDYDEDEDEENQDEDDASGEDDKVSGDSQQKPAECKQQ